jgi:hypothetical protein
MYAFHITAMVLFFTDSALMISRAGSDEPAKPHSPGVLVGAAILNVALGIWGVMTLPH